MKNENLKIIFSFTTNTIGGFEIGDGEYFTDEVNGIEDEFLILTEETEDSFIKYTYPCKITEDYKREKWEGKYWIDLATLSTKETYRKEDLIKHYQHIVNNEQMGTFYIPKTENEVFEINDFWFYYANSCPANNIEYTPILQTA